MRDLLIVGGGPAGLVTALHAARAGLSVAVCEPRPAPIDKACGEGLMPGAVTALDALGVDVGGRPFTGIRYLDGRGTSATADFRGACGRGVARVALHAALWSAASAAGVELVERRVDAVVRDDASVSAGGERARRLVAADGLHSPIRRWLGLERTHARHRRWGVRAHFACRPWTDHVEVYWSPDGEAYVTPLAADCVGVAILGATRGPFAERLAAFPALRDRLPSVPVDAVLGAGPLRQDVAARVAGRVLLVGDAAGYVDALTGEGLAIAFESAAALVARIASGEVAGYEHDYRAITRRYRLLTGALVAATRPQWARRRIVPLAARAPTLFRAGVHLMS